MIIIFITIIIIHITAISACAHHRRSRSVAQTNNFSAVQDMGENTREGPAYEEIYGMRLATTVRRSQPGAERALPWEQGATRGGGQRGDTRGGSQTRGRLGAPDHPSASRAPRERTGDHGDSARATVLALNLPSWPCFG